MRRIQIHIDEADDEALALEAARTGLSKAALIRECIARFLKPVADDCDPIDDIVGLYDGEVGDIDEVVYG